jgi:uncharacterized cupredoxin-like copper-binding protein
MSRDRVPMPRALAAAMVLLLLLAGGNAHADAAAKHTDVSRTFTFGHPGEPKNVTRIIKIFAFDNHFKPTHVTVSRGTTVRFIVTDVGKASHEFVLGDTDEQEEHGDEMRTMHGMPMSDEANAIGLAPGQTKSLVWAFTQDGLVEYACHLNGHFEAGMVGIILVRSAAANERQWRNP